MILSPIGDGIVSVAPDVFGMSSSIVGAILAGERIIFPDNNFSHSSLVPVFGYNVPSTRLAQFAVLQSRHIKLWDSSDLGSITLDATGSDDQHQAITLGGTSSPTHGMFGTGGVNAWLLSATSHLLIADAMFMAPILSDGVNTWYCRFGYANVLFGTTTHGAYFEYDANVSATGNLVTSAASVKTSTSTGVTIVAGTWYRVRVVCTNNTRVDLYIAPEGTPLPLVPSCSNTTNIPSGTAQAITPTCGWERTAGTASRFFNFTYFIAGADRLAA